MLKRLPIVLQFIMAILLSVPAFAQASNSEISPTQAQYDQYKDESSGAGDRAVRDAVTASTTIRISSEERRTNTAPASEGTPTPIEPEVAPSEKSEKDEIVHETLNETAKTSEPEELPDTGGPLLSWLGLPLALAGALVARRAILP